MWHNGWDSEPSRTEHRWVEEKTIYPDGKRRISGDISSLTSVGLILVRKRKGGSRMISNLKKVWKKYSTDPQGLNVVIEELELRFLPKEQNKPAKIIV